MHGHSAKRACGLACGLAVGLGSLRFNNNMEKWITAHFGPAVSYQGVCSLVVVGDGWDI